MPRRTIPVDLKVRAIREALCLHELDAQIIARKYGVTGRSLYNWYRRVIEALPYVLEPRKYEGKPEAANAQGGDDETVESN